MQKNDMKPETYEASPVVSAEQGVRTKPSFGTRAKRNLKRWWWTYFLAFAALVLIIVLPLIYVAFPKKAQEGVNESRLVVESQEIADPTPSSFRLRQVTTSYSDSKNHPTLGAFRAALFLQSTLPDIKPFAYVDLPSVKSTEKATIEVDQLVQIEDLEQFTRYTMLVQGSEEFSFGLRGRTDLSIGSLPDTTVDYDKVITMKGLNALEGLNITSFEVRLEPEEDGANMLGTVSIPNPSVMTLHMGNLTLNLSVEGQPIGTSLLPDVVLRPGLNEVPMRSTTNQSVVLNLLTTKYRDGNLPLEIVGNTSVYNGEHLTYYEAAISAKTIELNLNVGAALAEIGIDLSSRS